MKPIVNNELSFIKRVCRPTVEQMDAIVAKAKIAFDAMDNMIDEGGQQFAHDNSNTFFGPNQERIRGNPYTRVRDDAARYLKPLVDEHQYLAYVAESHSRDEFERGAAIDVIIGLIDHRVLLTAEQTKQLHSRMLKGWKNIDVQWVENYANNPNYMPQIDMAYVKPILNSDQLKLLTDASRQRVFMSTTLSLESSSSIGEQWIK